MKREHKNRDMQREQTNENKIRVEAKIFKEYIQIKMHEVIYLKNIPVPTPQ